MKRTAIIIAVLILVLLASCEPNDWEYILDGVDDVMNLNVVRNVDDVEFTYTLPEYPLCEFRGDDCFYRVYYYYSPAGSDVEIIIGENQYNPTEGDPGSGSFEMTFAHGLTGGSNYTFTVYTIDENYKPSEGVSKTISW